MEFIREHEGTQEWICPICGRNLLIEFHPRFRRVVLVAGEAVGHSGFTVEVEK